MFAKKITLVAALASLAVGPVTVHAEDDDALLNLLVKKRIITQKEATAVRSELAKNAEKEAPENLASKIKLSKWVTELELYGDSRVRYEIRSGETNVPNTLAPPGDTYQRNREQYRLPMACGEHWSMTGSSTSAWRLPATRDRPTSLLGMTPCKVRDRSQKTAIRSA